MKTARGFYSKEFKLNAVKLYINRERGKSISTLAKELKISAPTLSAWVLYYRDRGEDGLVENITEVNCKAYEALKLNSLKTELDVMQQAYNGLKKQLIEITKERDNMKKAIETFVSSLVSN